MGVLALIPARSGSKGIPHKNIRMFQGKPLLAHSIEHAQASRLIDRIIVTTDSAAYASIAKAFGAEVPFLRPSEIAQDYSTDLETFEHALTWLKFNEAYIPEVVVHLRPTYPLRRSEDIDQMIQLVLEHPEIDSVRSIVAAQETPYKMWLRNESGFLTPVANYSLHEPYNQPRQRLPQAYLQNACIDVVRTTVILEQHSMTGQQVYGYIMNENYDIDTEAQFGAVVHQLSTVQTSAIDDKALKTFCFDIDGVIASLTPGNQYELARPEYSVIDYINSLYDHGHTIILFTARGSLTGIDWTQLTIDQLERWGVKFHHLAFGKPAADYYVDDRAVNVNQLDELMSAILLSHDKK